MPWRHDYKNVKITIISIEVDDLYSAFLNTPMDAMAILF